jgi:predicted DNA-binding protein
MHMSGLTRRTQILLDEERYRRLQEQADESGRSVGSVIREAIDAKLGGDERARRRVEAGRRLLAQPPPTHYAREPDLEDWDDDLLDEKWRRMYPDAE